MADTMFVDLQKELFRLFELGKYDEVHTLIEKAQVDFPERLDKTIFWKACVYSV